MTGWLALASASGFVVAGESLPPLRVDPVLLGGAPLKPAQPAQPVQQPQAKPAQVEPTSAAPVEQKSETAKTETALPEAPRSAAEVSPVAPPPAARPLPASPARKSPAAPVSANAEKAAPLVPAAQRPASVPALAPRAMPLPAGPQTKTAKNLPPLRVDPALLGGGALAQRKPSTDTRPPEVAERPQLPPLYSAHVAAGVIPHPATTPFSATDKSSAPTYVTARHIDGVNEVEMVAEGDAVLERAGDTLLADRIVYRQAEDEVEAIGNVRLTAPDSVIAGPRLRMRMEESTGEFETPAYTIRRQPAAVPEPALTMSGLPAVDEGGNVLVKTGRMILPPPVTGSGIADRLEFRGEDQYHLENATYSTCAPGRRDWEVSVDELDLNYSDDIGKGRNALVTFKGVPILYSPWMSFALNNQRKSGLLTPTVGTTTSSGFEVATPWYWNIAPHMDATITPRILSKRGVQLNAEFRYLLNSSFNQAVPLGQELPDRGQVRVEYLPDDKLAKRDRYGYSIVHNQILGNGLTGALNLNGVSDSDYFSDLSTRIAQISQGNLLRQGVLTYGAPWYTATLNVQTYQTLQNPETLQDLPKPYQRLPQLNVTAFRHDLPLGLEFNLNAEYVNFDHPTALLAKRTILYPQLSLPFATSAFWLTPKIGVHSARYELDGQDRPEAAAWKNVSASQSSAVPIYSVDGGFVMERDVDWFGRSLVQTLEPRAYYLYVPEKDQRGIPIFDTGIAGFNYAQMFSENRYAGGDRVGDANQLTLAVTSRLLDPSGGEELLRATLGTRYYFSDQSERVFVPGEAIRNERKADILAALTGQVLPKTYADFAWQYNPRDSQTERFTLGGIRSMCRVSGRCSAAGMPWGATTIPSRSGASSSPLPVSNTMPAAGLAGSWCSGWLRSSTSRPAPSFSSWS
jgi:LPS-assembly protein